LYAIEEKDSQGFTSYDIISFVHAKSLLSFNIVFTDKNESSDSIIGIP
jgi:hypothetical protein